MDVSFVYIFSLPYLSRARIHLSAHPCAVCRPLNCSVGETVRAYHDGWATTTTTNYTDQQPHSHSNKSLNNNYIHSVSKSFSYLSHSVAAFVSILICHCGHEYLSLGLYMLLGLVIIANLWRLRQQPPQGRPTSMLQTEGIN